MPTRYAENLPPSQRLAARVLIEAGARLGASLDYGRTLENVAELLTEEFADYCVIDNLAGGEFERVAVAARDGDLRVLDWLRRDPLNQHPSSTLSEAAESRKPVLRPTLDEGFVERLGDTPDRREHLELLGAQSLLAVPLVARDRLVGVMLFISTRPERRFDADDLFLAQLLAERAAQAIDNARLYQEAQAAIAARDALQRTVIHDLRGPLSTLNVALGVVERHVADQPDTPELVTKSLSVQHRALGHLRRLTDDLLVAGQLDSGQLHIAPQRTHPATLLAQAAELFGAQADEANVQLVVEPGDELPELWADEGRVLQIFSNLIGNALKFTEPGGRICLRAHATDGGVRFEVVDTGHGIPAEQLPHLFERYWQASTGDRRGAGLGLAIVDGLVAAHGGRIDVESEVGIGTTVRFELPLQPMPDAK